MEEIGLYRNRTPREHGRLRGNRDNSAGTGDSAEIGGTPQEWRGSVEQVRPPQGKGQHRRNGGGGTPGNRWDSRERDSAGKELCGKGTPHAGGDSEIDSLGGQQSMTALSTCLH